MCFLLQNVYFTHLYTIIQELMWMLLGGKKFVNINLLFHLRLKLLLKKKKTLEVSILIIKHTPLKLNANTNPKNMGCSLNWIMVHLDLDSPLFIYLFILSLKPHINIKNTISSIKFQTVLFWQTFRKTKGPKAFHKIKKRRKRKIKILVVRK